MTKDYLKVGDKVAIAKLAEPDRNEELYGWHGVITKIEWNSVFVESAKWEELTGVKQDVKIEHWFTKAEVFISSATSRYIFEPISKPVEAKIIDAEQERRKLTHLV